MPTSAEQLFLEMLNRARLDPLAEAARLDMDLNAGLAPGTLDSAARQALAPNADLKAAAAVHSQWQLDANIFSHTGAGDSNISDRIRAVLDLTPPWRVGENLSWQGSTGQINLDQTVVAHHDGLFNSPGHRLNILQGDFDQIGIAQIAGPFTHDGTTFKASMMTNKFVGQGSMQFLTGVIYHDTDQDGFYSIGEGQSGVAIAGNGQTVQSSASGGYTLGLPAALAAVSITTATATLEAQVDLAQGNVKLDLIDELRLMSSGDLVLGAGVTEAGLLSVADLSLTGNNADNMLHAGRGNNVIHGGGGVNTAIFTGQQSDYTISEISLGTITITDLRSTVEAQGMNTLHNIHRAQFSDRIVLLQDQLPDPTHSLELTLIRHDGTTIGAAQISFTPAQGTPIVLDQTATGGADLSAMVGQSGHLNAERSWSPAEGDPGITALDALEVLRMAVGLTPSFGTAQAQHFIAADINRDGQVTALDALEVLRAAVGLSTEHAPRWVFFDAATDWEALDLNAANTHLPDGMALEAGWSSADLALTGILLGNLSDLA